MSDKAKYKWCNNCHLSTFPGQLELSDGANKKFIEKKRLKQKKAFAKDKADKSKKKVGQSHGKKISANVAESASDSEGERSASSVDSDSEEERKKSGKRKKKTLTDKPQLEAHAQCVDILNAMDSKARKKLCKFYISSESAGMIVDMDESTKPASSWQYNRLENPFMEGMTVGFASDAQEQLSGQVVTEENLTSEIPIPNMAIPNIQIQVPFGDLGLPFEPATYLQLIDDTEGGLEIRRQAELELESLHILQANLDLMWESEQTLEQEHFAVDSWIAT